jgi:hypothetical protein
LAPTARWRAARGGGGLWPPFFLGGGDGVEEFLPLLHGCQEEEFSWQWLGPPKVGFPINI